MSDPSNSRSLSEDFPEPCLAVVIVPTETGPKIPVVFREKGNEQWWDLPGGKRRMDEDPCDAVENECLEEIDTKVKTVAYLDSAEHPKTGLPKRHFFAAAYVSGTPINNVPDEHLDMQLMSPEKAAELLAPRVPQSVRDYMTSAVHYQDQITPVPGPKTPSI